ncbi:MAG: glutamyl-tRNA reductase [Methanomicrobiaceae archaeon]|nr:glutamyl-tRNA reductase [Methanomicrobiaceae archaeon]
MTRTLHVPIAVGGISHHDADIGALEQFRFDDELSVLSGAREWFRGVCLLQTCNRIELIVHGEASQLEAFFEERGRCGYWILAGEEALRHLLQLAAGMDSMIVGEDQILGQLKAALSASQEAGACSAVIDHCIKKAVHVGVEVRKRTQINKGAVSIGSAAVQLGEHLLGSLDGRHITVVGGGEMGTLVTKALAAKQLTAIYVTNRTYERAQVLAREVGGKAVKFEELYHYISLSDVVISCTAAPHPVIHAGRLTAMMEERRWPLDQHPRPLIIIDIAQPRDVEPSVGSIHGVHLFSIDDLRNVSENNLHARKKEASMAARFLEEEISRFVVLLNGCAAEDALAALHTWAEAIRVRERDRARVRLQGADERTLAVFDDFSRVLAKKLLLDATFAIRTGAECGHLEEAEALVMAITRGETTCIRKKD